MPKLAFVTVDVFTKTRYEGNPLAILQIPQGQDVPTERMQKIANEFNLSETVFIYETDEAATSHEPEWRVRIFMPKAELPFAGHPTIGTAYHALTTLSRVKATKGRFTCNAGPIDLQSSDGDISASIPHNVRVHSQHPLTLENVHELQPVLKNAAKPLAFEIVSPVKGMNFVTVELPDLETLGLLRVSGVQHNPQLDEDWISDGHTGFCGTHWYVVISTSTESSPAQVQLRVRMFERSFEDPATGSAACGLSSMLAMKNKYARVTKFEVIQAVEIGRKSVIGVTVTLNESLDAVERVELSGSAIQVMEGFVAY